MNFNFQYNKTLVTHLDTLGNAFDSLRVPRPESASSSQHEERSASPISESASQPQSSSLSSTQKSVGKEDLETEDKVENKVYPVCYFIPYHTLFISFCSNTTYSL